MACTTGWVEKTVGLADWRSRLSRLAWWVSELCFASSSVLYWCFGALCFGYLFYLIEFIMMDELAKFGIYATYELYATATN